MDVDSIDSVDRQPGGKEQDGQPRPVEKAGGRRRLRVKLLNVTTV